MYGGRPEWVRKDISGTFRVPIKMGEWEESGRLMC